MKYAYSYIRFSSQQQARGDSLRRQTEEAAKWAEENGYTLKDLSFKDLGVSAYSGANVRGGLGQFLQAIDAGVVQAGESLLIESLDRLSRDEVLIALGIFGQILQAGVAGNRFIGVMVFTCHCNGGKAAFATGRIVSHRPLSKSIAQ